MLFGKIITKKRIVAVFLSLCALLQSFVFTAWAEEGKESVSEVISRGFYDFSESIDISIYEISPEELTMLVSSIIKDDPYLFFVNGHLSYSYKSGGFVLSLKPTYNMTREEVFDAWERCRGRAREIAALAEVYDDQARRALFVHDYICENYEYDDTMECDDLSDFFDMGKGTCQGYAAAYTAVLRELGIPCHFVASDTISHIWNLVEIDGKWYHVDLTWDDSVGVRSRRHFLLSDAVAAERGHKDWYSTEEFVCDSEKYADDVFDDWFKDVHFSGDGDHSGEVDLADLLYLRRLVSSGEVAELCENCADINVDGVLDTSDIAYFRKKLLAVD